MGNKLFICAIVMMIAGGIYASRITGLNAAKYQQVSAVDDDTLKGKPVIKADTTKHDNDTVAKKKKDEYADIIKKGGTVKEGLFTVRHIQDKWYFEIPDTLLGRYFMCVTRYTAVPQNFGKYAGEEVNEATVYFEKHDYKTMYMRAYVLTQLADSTDRISKTLQASTIDPIVASFKIIGKSPKGRSMIEITNFFKNDNKLTTSVRSSLGMVKLGGMISSRSYIDTMKVFPINIEVATVRTYGATANRNAPASLTGSVTLGMNTSMVLLPSQPMRKRLWDKRVGYFVNNFTRFSDTQHKTQRESFIARYRLVPRDVKAYRQGRLVEPVKPIIYYIDPATPKKWVPYLIKGVEDWNVAFEAAGFKNAIQAKPWPNDSNMSVDDARYCVIRYLPAEIENAYGPHVSDPRSGEIIESHICWYHNVMSLLTKWYMVQCGPLDKRAQTMTFDDKLMGELIRFVSSHEVGHTLGLRHNMGASHATPVEKLRDKAWVEAHGHTASIMDYARFNYVAQPEDSISRKGIFPRIGPYDRWAIQWGYTPMFDAYDTESDHWELERLVQEADLPNHPRLWFGDGETNRTRDSRCQTEDLGDDAVKASEYGIRNLKRELKQLPEWTYQSNDIYQDNLRGVYEEIIGQFQRYCGHVIGYIGGCCYNYRTIDEGGPYYTLIPRKRQLESVEYLDRHIFHEPTWLTSEPFVATLVPNRQALSSNIGKRILNSALNVLPSLNDEYPSSDYLNDLTNRLFGELKTGAKLTPYRRDLQRLFVMVLCENYSEPNMQQNYYGDVLLTLRRLQREYKAARPADQATRAFYAAMIDILDRKLEIK